MNTKSLLSKRQILRHREEGNIIIHPFDEKNVNTVSVDVRLGEFFFHHEGTPALFNPFSQQSSHGYWSTPRRAEKSSTLLEETPEHISADDRIILLQPHETVLGHTLEFIGGRACITTEIRAKSSMNRIGLTVSPSGGWGDVGFYNRWMLMLTNMLTVPLVLVAGMRIAQVVFYAVDPEEESYYAGKGQYQTTGDVAQMVAAWKPEDLLPQLHRDRDIGQFHTFLDGHTEP